MSNMAKTAKTNVLAVILVLLTISLFALSLTLVHQYTIANQKLIRLYNIEDKYIALQANFTSIKSQLYNLTSAYSLLKSEYEQISSNYSTLYSEYKNLSIPYIKKLYKDQVISIANESPYNISAQQLYGTYVAHYYNFSFYAPYNGYLLLNYSVYPAIQNGSVELDIYNNYTSPTTVALGTKGTLVKIPIPDGTQDILFVNYNNISVTILFSAEYVGYRN
ncbi:MAG: hypothetical protein ACP5U0_10370 [Caldisphaera sp.]